MLKRQITIWTLLISSMMSLNCHAEDSAKSSSNLQEETDSGYNFHDPETNKNFIVDFDNSANGLLRICVPILYPQWFAVPLSSIEEIKITETRNVEGTTLTFAHIQFQKDNVMLNSILDSFQKLIIEENSKNELFTEMRWGWRAPWTWSRCAKM